MQTVDSLLQLEAGSAAKTATGNGTGINADLTKSNAAIIRAHVSACDFTTGDETYVLIAAISDVVGGTYTEVSRVTIPGGSTGIFEMALTGVGAKKLDTDGDWVRISWTLGGTSPSLTFQAYVCPVT